MTYEQAETELKLLYPSSFIVEDTYGFFKINVWNDGELFPFRTKQEFINKLYTLLLNRNAA